MRRQPNKQGELANTWKRFPATECPMIRTIPHASFADKQAFGKSLFAGTTRLRKATGSGVTSYCAKKNFKSRRPVAEGQREPLFVNTDAAES
jgi:hypothetical protein